MAKQKKGRTAARPQKKGAFASSLRVGLLEILGIGALSLAIFMLSGQLASWLGPYSYAGAFALTLLASAGIFIPTSVLQLAIVGMAPGLNPLGLAAAAGIGSGIGELTAYFFGSGSLHLLEAQHQHFKWLIRLQKGILRTHMGLGIFVLSAVPNPFFDVAGILAGLMKMRWQEFLFWCILGRILRFLLMAYFGLWAAGML